MLRKSTLAGKINGVLGNYDLPTNWPQPVMHNAPGDVPGAPVMYGPSQNPDEIGAGYGYQDAEAKPETNIFYYHSDHLGSTSYITDNEGNATQFVYYMPYGALVDEHTTTPDPAYLTAYKFNGKEMDAETGLYYYGARYYEPELAMWYGVDALAEKYSSYSPYNYCVSNPVKFVNPDRRIYDGQICVESFNPVEQDADFADTDFTSCVGLTTGEYGNQGVTYMPTAICELGKSSAIKPNSIHININPSFSQTGATETFSHEGYGHALIYVETGGDRKQAVHHSVGTKETNQNLIEKTITARKEKIENIRQ